MSWGVPRLRMGAQGSGWGAHMVQREGELTLSQEARGLWRDERFWLTAARKEVCDTPDPIAVAREEAL